MKPSANQGDDWEFFCAHAEAPGPRFWGWRRRRDGALICESAHFETFLDCYRDALRNGFRGDIRFSA
jgi:hypothetical protein